MKDNNKTTIAISNQLWKKLNDYKVSPKETFEDVIKKLLSKNLKVVKSGRDTHLAE